MVDPDDVGTDNTVEVGIGRPLATDNKEERMCFLMMSKVRTVQMLSWFMQWNCIQACFMHINCNEQIRQSCHG